MHTQPLLEIIKGGLLTTVQDLGRPGRQHAGVVVGGAADSLSARLANLLAGNPEGSAVLEITLQGPVLRFLTEAVIAVTGADLNPRLDGREVPMGQTIPVTGGQILSFGPRKSGCRAYLAVAGGIAVPEVMGSRSTYLPAGFGGYQGRPLRAGDILEGYQVDLDPVPLRRIRQVPGLSGGPVRVIPGPQHDWFVPGAMEILTSREYRVTAKSNRMGLFLNGPVLARARDDEFISDATTFGSIQVLPGGEPVILLADGQTTGGYPKIATVASIDWPLLAQAAPGDVLRFRAVEVEGAQRALAEREKGLLEAFAGDLTLEIPSGRGYYRIIIGESNYSEIPANI